MFFQRKKKRLLRELRQARLIKPPTTSNVHRMSVPFNYYETCLRSRIVDDGRSCPETSDYLSTTSERQWGRGCEEEKSCCSTATGGSLHSQEEKAAVSNRRRSTGRTRSSGFCQIMGHCCGDAQSTCSSEDNTSHWPRPDTGKSVDEEEEAFLEFLGDRLAPQQLQTLLGCTKGQEENQTTTTTSACVLIRRQDAMSWNDDLHMIACRMWRWADLDSRLDILKRVPSCPNGKDPVYICCNPCHWFRVLQHREHFTETPLPPYNAFETASMRISDYGQERTRGSQQMCIEGSSDSPTKQRRSSYGTINDTEDRGRMSWDCREEVELEVEEESSITENGSVRCIGGAPNRRHQCRCCCCGVDDSLMSPSGRMTAPPVSSVSTHGQDKSAEGWCSLAYWEQSTRVGAVIKVARSSINLVSSHPRNDDICLSKLAAGVPKCVANTSTRTKIGSGIIISYEGNSMWLYNRSTSPIFVHSATICDVDSYRGGSSSRPGTVVLKLYPGYCMKAYNPGANMSQYRAMAEQRAVGPVDVHSVRISFVKGWGPSFKRQDIKTCPCWLEVILNPCHFICADDNDERSLAMCMS